MEEGWPTLELASRLYAHCLANPVATNQVYAKLLENLLRVKVLIPDLVYGLRAVEADELEQMIQDDLGQYYGLSQEIRHAFFIVKAKSSEGTIGDAEDQCFRGGAALIHVRMKWVAEAVCDILAVGEDLPTGADLESIAFSLAVVPLYAHMFVHRAEVRFTPSRHKWEGAKAEKATTVAYHVNRTEDCASRACNGS